MKTKHLFKILAAGLLLSAGAANAALYNVTIDTAALIPLVGANGPFSLDFQLNNGDLPGNNTVTISSFAFTGGSATAGTEFTFGGASGSLSSQVNLGNSGQLSEFSQEFTPGTLLTFNVFFTQNLDNITPDSFSIAILEGDFDSITTDGFNNTLLQFDIDTTNPNPDSELVIGAGTGAYDGVTLTAIPEPSAALLGLLGCLGLVIRRRGA